MDEPDTIEIVIDNLPSNLTIGELRNYLYEIYPNKYINIYHSPLAKFGDLPSELLSHIITSEPNLISSSIGSTRAIRNASKKTFYETECQRDISKQEILKETEDNRNEKNHIIVIDETQLDNYNVSLYTYLYEKSNIKRITRNNFMTCMLNNANLIWIAIEYDEDEEYTDYINKKDIITDVDLFTEYRIRSKRTICLDYNKNYANEYLINEYNEKIVGEFEDIISFEDVKNIFIINYIAYFISNKQIELLEIMVDLTNKNNTEILVRHFHESREVIRNKIIALTGAKLSKENPYYLIL